MRCILSRIQIPFAILFFIVSVLFFAPEQTATAQNVNIPDANLRNALEKKLGKKAGEAITQAEMASVTVIYQYSDGGIRNLTGLEFATNLTYLYLGFNYISDISPLKGLVKLTDLYFYDNYISDISPLKELVNLTSLSLSENQISDISPLKGLVKLTWLQLDNNQIIDFSPIAGLIDNLDSYRNSNQIPTWDVNQDGKVDILDLTAVAQNFGTATTALPRADVNGDGTVDILDLVAIASHFGERTTNDK